MHMQRADLLCVKEKYTVMVIRQGFTSTAQFWQDYRQCSNFSICTEVSCLSQDQDKLKIWRSPQVLIYTNHACDAEFDNKNFVEDVTVWLYKSMKYSINFWVIRWSNPRILKAGIPLLFWWTWSGMKCLVNI